MVFDHRTSIMWWNALVRHVTTALRRNSICHNVMKSMNMSWPKLSRFRLPRIYPNARLPGTVAIPIAPNCPDSLCPDSDLPWMRMPRISLILLRRIALIAISPNCPDFYCPDILYTNLQISLICLWVYGPIVNICKGWPKTQNKSNVYLNIFYYWNLIKKMD